MNCYGCVASHDSQVSNVKLIHEHDLKQIRHASLESAFCGHDQTVPGGDSKIPRARQAEAAALRQSPSKSVKFPSNSRQIPSNFRQIPSNFRQILRGPSVKFRQIRQIRQIPDPARALRQIPDPARPPGLMHAQSLSNFT